MAGHDVYRAPRILLDLHKTEETYSNHGVTPIMRSNRINALHGCGVPQYAEDAPALLIVNTLQRGFTVFTSRS